MGTMSLMLSGLFVAWSWPFILTLLVFSGVLIALLEHKHETLSALLIVSYFTAFYFFGGFNILHTILVNPWWALSLVGTYFAIGAVWSLFKWHLYVSDWRERFGKFKVEFLTSNGVKDATAETLIPDEFRELWFTKISTYGLVNKPKHTDESARVKTWIGFWPWSVMWFMLNEPIQRLAKWLYKILGNVYATITAWNTAGMEDDFKVPEPKVKDPADPVKNDTGMDSIYKKNDQFFQGKRNW